MFWNKKNEEYEVSHTINRALSIEQRLGNIERHISEVVTAGFKGKYAKHVKDGKIVSFKIKNAFLWPEGLTVVGGDQHPCFGWEHRSLIKYCEITDKK